VVWCQSTFFIHAKVKGGTMGDKSPKAKDKAKKQHTADKNQKQAFAAAKASTSGAAGSQKSK
jgi:hypothetical protein